MDGNGIHRRDMRSYRKLIGLSQRQLATIHARLQGGAGNVENVRFWFRNRSIKKSISSLLEKMEDLKRIETDAENWPGVDKAELDYILIMLHGMRDMSEFEEAEQA